MLKTIKILLFLPLFVFSSCTLPSAFVTRRVVQAVVARTLGQSAPFRHSLIVKCPSNFMEMMAYAVEEVKVEAKENALAATTGDQSVKTHHHDTAIDNQSLANAHPSEIEIFEGKQRHLIHSGQPEATHWQHSSPVEIAHARFVSNENQLSQHMSEIAYNAKVATLLASNMANTKAKLSFNIAHSSTLVQKRISEIMQTCSSLSPYELQIKQEEIARSLPQFKQELQSLMDKNSMINVIIHSEKYGGNPGSIPSEVQSKLTFQDMCEVNMVLKLEVEIKARESAIHTIDCKIQQEKNAFTNELKDASLEKIEKITSNLITQKEAITVVRAQTENELLNFKKNLKKIQDQQNLLSKKIQWPKIKQQLKSLAAEQKILESKQNNARYKLEYLKAQGRELDAQIDQAYKVAAEKQIELQEAWLAQEKQEYEAQLQKQQGADFSYNEQLKNQYDSLNFNNEICPDSVLYERQQALSQTESDGYASYDQEHFLSPQAAAFLQKHGIDYSHVHNFHGTALQQQLHSEYCGIVEQTAEKQAQLPYQSDLLKQCVLCADAAYDANQLGQIKTVVSLNNLGFALLEYGQAVNAGVSLGLQGVAHTMLHPVQAVESVGKAVYYVLETAALNCYSEEDGFEDLYIPLRDQRNAEIIASLKNLSHAIADSTGPEKVQALTQFAVEFAVPGKIMKVVGGVVGAAESAAVKGASCVESEINAAKAVQKVEAVAQKAVAKNVAKELMHAEQQFDKSAKVVTGHSAEPLRTDKYGIIKERSFVEKKISALENAQKEAELINNKLTKTLPDGRIRYHDPEVPSTTLGPTRGRSHVTEFDPKTGRVRLWEECYDHAGNVNRVRPEMINGRDLVSQHYPATWKDIQENIKGSKWFIPKR